jgi:hypothetical protein
MPADEPMENARAAGEAREAVVRRPRGPAGVEDALKRYLASESYHAHRREELDREERDDEDATSPDEDR